MQEETAERHRRGIPTLQRRFKRPASLMFYKRLCDQWECEADDAIAELEKQQKRKNRFHLILEIAGLGPTWR